MEKLKSGFEFIFSSYKRTAAILFIAALTLAIPITITLVGQQQDIRQRAATAPTPPCTIPASLGVGTRGYGDVNGDGQVNSVDSSFILQYVADDRGLSQAKIEAADVDGSPNVLSSKRDVNSIDSTLILQFTAGAISTFPACPTTTPTTTGTPSTDTIPPTSLIKTPAAGSTQTSTFAVTVVDSDNTGGSGLAKCEYAVTDYNNGFTVERTIRACNSQIFITVGPNGNCRTEGADKCTVRADSTDNAGNLASLSFRSFSISYSGTSPTPTGITPGATSLNVSITLSGIGISQNPALGINNNPKRPQRNVEVTIVNSGNQRVDLTKSPVNYDSATGKYKGNVNLGSNFVSGSYLVKVRLDNTLWKTIPGIQNITSRQTYTAPETTLVSGDIIQDNEINLLDYNALLSCIGPQACATKVQADLNDDDKVEELDLNILYAGFAKRKGD